MYVVTVVMQLSSIHLGDPRIANAALNQRPPGLGLSVRMLAAAPPPPGAAQTVPPSLANLAQQTAGQTKTTNLVQNRIAHEARQTNPATKLVGEKVSMRLIDIHVLIVCNGSKD